MNRQKGFTLIELVLVIVILGILAATALPRFVDLSVQARVAAVNGLAGSVRSAAALAKATQLALGYSQGQQVSMETAIVTMSGRYPTANAAGIEAALSDSTGFEVSSASAPRTWRLNSDSNCSVSYSNSGSGYTVSVVSSGC